MKAAKVTRPKRLHVRFTALEYETLHNRCNKTTCKNISQYARKMLLQKPVTIYQRNQSLDEMMPHLIALKNDLNAIANNYNQVVRKLHLIQNIQDLQSWGPQHEIIVRILSDKIAGTKTLIAKLSDKWLQ
ncbi:plasmid mobilization protein [Paraflavitalea pollutisoli]|uniref:plasmid mobilization protein n=1 Tax=Paraflavitalea pollutisoli TaxID=3034143 RepID=UPI0023EC8C91|nr:hypothetical protein [Paraflavitalea sp. H1-2-19X]